MDPRLFASDCRALYLHIPFCKAKCLYCDFDSKAPCATGFQAQLDRYLDSLLSLIEGHGKVGHLAGVQTVYIGGGTPSIAGDRLVRVVELVRSFCNPSEFTCEANPESFIPDLAYALANAGVTRISLGVQTLVDSELHAIGRIHSARQALDAIRIARDAGLHVSGDLMCGLPGQTLESWSSSLLGLIEADPNHVSIYPLQLEEGTPLYDMELAGKVKVPTEDFQASCMDLAAEVLGQAGYERYEVASYAKPGFACRHNISYWSGVSYLGLGRSAAGMIDRGPQGRIRFVQLDDEGTDFDIEELSARQAAAEDLMLACRMTRGIDSALLDRSSRWIPRQIIDEACGRAVYLGLAEWVDGRLVPTHKGWLEGNELFGLFWELAG